MRSTAVHDARARGARAASIVAAIVIVGALLPATAAKIAAQTIASDAPRVSVQHGLTLGTMYRAGMTVIDYRSARAAQYSIWGESGRRALLTVRPAGLLAGGLGEALAMDVSNVDCAFSVDGGVTWQLFSTGLLQQEVMFPAGLAPTSEILVRVGCRVACSATQQRGAYSGGVSLNADYLPLDVQANPNYR